MVYLWRVFSVPHVADIRQFKLGGEFVSGGIINFTYVHRGTKQKNGFRASCSSLYHPRVCVYIYIFTVHYSRNVQENNRT